MLLSLFVDSLFVDDFDNYLKNSIILWIYFLSQYRSGRSRGCKTVFRYTREYDSVCWRYSWQTTIKYKQFLVHSNVFPWRGFLLEVCSFYKNMLSLSLFLAKQKDLLIFVLIWFVLQCLSDVINIKILDAQLGANFRQRALKSAL